LLDGSPLRQHWQRVNSAIVSLIYEPLQFADSWGRDPSACKLYVCLLAKLYGPTDFSFPQGVNTWELLITCVKEFNLSVEMEDEVAVEDTNENKNDSTHRTFNNLTSRTLKKGKTKPINREDANHFELQVLIGISYPAGPGHRTIVGVTDDGRPESVPRSQWQRYLPSKCSKQERTDWLERYPNSASLETEKLQKPTQMSYGEFRELKTKCLYRLVKSQMGSMIPILATMETTNQVIKVNRLSQEQFSELYQDVDAIEEGIYKPRKEKADNVSETDNYQNNKEIRR
jgi:hypothetical protein